MNRTLFWKTVREMPVLMLAAGVGSLIAAMFMASDAYAAPVVFAAVTAGVLLTERLVNAALPQRGSVALCWLALALGWAVLIAWLVYAPHSNVLSLRLLVAVLLVASAGMRVHRWTAMHVTIPVALVTATLIALVGIQILNSGNALYRVALAVQVELGAAGCDWLLASWVAAARLTLPDWHRHRQEAIVASVWPAVAAWVQHTKESR